MGTLWSILRACGIGVGIATLLRLATISFNVEFNDVFQAFLDRMRAFFELDAVIDVIEEWFVRPTLMWLRGFDLDVPDLQPHWRPVFTLTWLLMMAHARNRVDTFAVQGLRIAWLVYCALLTAIAAGTQPLASWAVALWPAAGFMLYLAGALLEEPRKSLNWAAAAATTATVGILFPPPAVSTAGLGEHNLAALFVAVALVVFFGLWMFTSALSDRAKGEWPGPILSHPAMAASLDVLGVIGGAFAIGYLMLK